MNDLITLKDSDGRAIDLLTNETMITYKIDTGAQTNIHTDPDNKPSVNHHRRVSCMMNCNE